MKYLGDFLGTETLAIRFTTHAATGGAVAPSTAFEAADVRIYRDGSNVERDSQAGFTMTSPFDGVVGLHLLTVDLSDDTDEDFFEPGHEYSVVLVPDETVDGQTVVAVLAEFSIQNRPATVRTQLALPAVAPDAAGGLPVSDAGGLDLDTLLGRLDAAISTRLAAAAYTAPLSAAGTRAAVGLAAANLDVQIAALAAFIDTEIADTLEVVTWLKKVQRGRKYFATVAGVERLHVVDPDLTDDGLEPTVTGTLLLDQVALDKDGNKPVHQGTGVAKVGASAA